MFGFAHHGGCGNGRHAGYGGDGERKARGWSRGGFEQNLRRTIRHTLGLSDEQTDTVDVATDHVRDALKELLATVKESRGDLAATLRGEKLDEARLATIFELHDDALKKARRDVVAALKQVHEELTPEQRVKLADLLASGPTWV